MSANRVAASDGLHARARRYLVWVERAGRKPTARDIRAAYDRAERELRTPRHDY